MCSELSWCMNRGQFQHSYKHAIKAVDEKELSDYNKILLKNRFLPMMNSMEVEAKRVNLLFTLFQIVTTLGSIVVPALLSIEEVSFEYNTTSFDIERQSHNIFWLTWGISMAVTISNGFNQLLGLERKYILRNVSVSQIQKEGWSFLEKSGDVYGQLKHKTLNDIIHIFWKRVEKLRYEQIVVDLTIQKSINIDVDDPADLESQIPKNDSSSDEGWDDFSGSGVETDRDAYSPSLIITSMSESLPERIPLPTPVFIPRPSISPDPNMFLRTISNASTVSPLTRAEDENENEEQRETVSYETVV